MIDLEPRYLTQLEQILHRFVGDTEVRVFGSRVKGTAKPFSDIDLVVMNQQALPLGEMAQLNLTLEESDLPYKVDIVQWSELTPKFQALINEKFEVLV